MYPTTRMLSAASSAAKHVVSVIIARLLAAYTLFPAVGKSPPNEEPFKITPPPHFFIQRAAV